ncbi:aconitate hydratase [Coemansia sp. RSA 988]|nr:aconitate hydratase [Coemansia sp. RSA 988]
MLSTYYKPFGVVANSTPRKRDLDDGGSDKDDVVTPEAPIGIDLESKAVEESSAQHNPSTRDTSVLPVSVDTGSGDTIQNSTLAYVPPPMEATKPTVDDVQQGEYHKDVSINHSENRQILAQSATHRIVMEATVVRITTRGRYYPDPANATPADPELHLHVEATTQESLDKAVAMIERMKIEGLPERPISDGRRTDSFSGPSNTSDRHRGGRSGSGSSSRFQDKVFIEVESERGFNVRAKLIGTGGENMKYIQNTTGAQVQVRGRGSGYSENYSNVDNNEPMHLLVVSDHEDSQAQAIEYGRSLVDTIHAQYREFRDNGNRRRDRHTQRNGRDRYEQRYPRHGDRSEQDSQFYAPHHEQQYLQQQYPVSHHMHPSTYPRPNEGSDQLPQATNSTQAYEEYANYCAQYYQYYGTYPDYSAYYGQADPMSAQQVQAQPPAQPPQSIFQENGSATTGEVPQQGGYHNVPPPASYSNEH